MTSATGVTDGNDRSPVLLEPSRNMPQGDLKKKSNHLFGPKSSRNKFPDIPKLRDGTGRDRL